MRTKTLAKTHGWWKQAFERGVYPLVSMLRDPQWTKVARGQASFARRVLELPRKAKVLDVGCGVGRHAIPLARYGYRVTGVDISAVYLREARREAARRRVEVALLRKDMRELDFRSEFDAAINLFTSFGFFPDPRDDLQVLRNFSRALKPGGVLLLDTINGTRIRRILDLSRKNGLPTNRWSRLRDGTYVLEEPILLRREGGVRTNWMFLKGQSRKEMVSFVRMYSRERLSSLFRRAGLRVERVYGDMKGARYDASRSPRLVILARKPSKAS